MANTATRPAAPWGTAGGGGMIASYFDSVFGEALYPSLFFWQFAARRRVPPNYGVTIKINRLKRQTGVVKVQTLTSYGSTVTAASMAGLCSNVVSGTLKKFRGVYGNSDIALLTSLGDPTEFAVRDIARDLALQIDTDARTTISAISNGALITPLGNSANLATTGIKLNTIIKAVGRLRACNNPRWPDGTFPLIIHPLVTYDLRQALSSGAAATWQDINKANTGDNAEKLFRGEIGRIFGARIVESSNVRRISSSAAGVASQGISAGQSGWQNIMLAPEAIYGVEMDQMNGRVIVKGLGSAGSLDADNSLSTVAAKMFCCTIRGFQSATPNTAGSETRIIRLVTGSNG